VQSYENRQNIERGLGTGINLDAWGRQKVVLDYSLLHGVFTYDVPNRVWEEYSVTSGVYAPLPQTGTLCSSVNNILEVASGTVSGDGSALFSKRHPRYQPNRGHIYSVSVILPSPELDAVRRFGIFKDDNGVYFQLEGDGVGWTMYAVRKSNGVEENKQDITSLLPATFDPSKNNVYDIQYQWRSAGDYYFYVNLAKVYQEKNLGTLTEASIRQPGLPAGFESITNTTTNALLRVGCVDVSSEGGKLEGRQFESITTGSSLITATSTGTAMIGVKIPRLVSYGGGSIENTRDIVASRVSSWTRDEAAVQIYAVRDTEASNLDGLTWTAFPDSTAQYLIGGNASLLDNAFQLDRGSMQLILSEWDDIERKNVIVNPDQAVAPFYITAGDILVCAIQTFAGNDNSSVTLYLSEEV